MSGRPGNGVARTADGTGGQSHPRAALRARVQASGSQGQLNSRRASLPPFRSAPTPCCRGLAGVEPTFTTHDGDDPDGYVLSVNIARRHLSNGQQAMVAARARLVSNQTQREMAEATGLNSGRIGHAKTVLDYAPELADAVTAGTMPLDKAYSEARRIKKEGETDHRVRLPPWSRSVGGHGESPRSVVALRC